MKVEFKQTAPKEGCYGDCTADYEVIPNEPCTVKDFINWVITDKSNEWGCIGVSFNDKHWAQFCKVKCEYRWGNMLSSLPEKYLEMTVCRITAHGGYSGMDYVLIVKGGKR